MKWSFYGKHDEPEDFFFWASFFAKNLSSHDPTYWFQIVKKGDWLVLGVVEPGP